MAYTIKIDKQSCLSSGRCVTVAPEGFAFDGDELAETLPGVASVADERLLEIAKSCPSYAILVCDEQGRELDLTN